MIESLHNHTTTSDGKLTHEEMFTLAESLGVGIFAFTDHDALPPEGALAFLESKRGEKTKWVVGIEMTSSMPHEVADPRSDLHIIGLFTDPSNQALRDHCGKAQQARRDRMVTIVRALGDLGFTLTEDDCLRAAGGDSVGKPHIVQALSAYPENLARIEALRQEFEMVARMGTDTELRAKYDAMMARGPRQYPYSLFLAPDAFRPINTTERTYLPDFDEAIALIRGAGGVASLAHYCYANPELPIELLESLLASGRIDGTETVYGLGNYGTPNEDAWQEERATLKAFSKKYSTIATGGADAHSREDLEYYTNSDRRWFTKDTVGMASRLLDRVSQTRTITSSI